MILKRERAIFLIKFSLTSLSCYNHYIDHEPISISSSNANHLNMDIDKLLA